VDLRKLTTNKASRGDGIPVELFQILKDDAVKVPQSICQQIWKTQQWLQDWITSVFIPISKKGNAKNSTTELHSSHTLVMFKILQARLQQYVNNELPDVQAGFRKGKGTRVEKEMATHSSTLDWKIPWMEETGRLQSMGS